MCSKPNSLSCILNSYFPQLFSDYEESELGLAVKHNLGSARLPQPNLFCKVIVKIIIWKGILCISENFLEEIGGGDMHVHTE